MMVLKCDYMVWLVSASWLMTALSCTLSWKLATVVCCHVDICCVNWGILVVLYLYASSGPEFLMWVNNCLACYVICRSQVVPPGRPVLVIFFNEWMMRQGKLYLTFCTMGKDLHIQFVWIAFQWSYWGPSEFQ